MFSLPAARLLLHVVVRERRCARVEQQCVSYLAVVSTRTSLLPLLPCYMRLPRCYGELGWPRASRTVSSYFSVSCYHQDDVKTYLCSPLCRFTSPTPTPYPPVCICTSIVYLLSGTTRHVLTGRCLSAAYPGIQPMVLYLCSSYSPLLPPFAMSYPFTNSLKCAACDDAFMSFFPPCFF